jgi:hypothetical protein
MGLTICFIGYLDLFLSTSLGLSEDVGLVSFLSTDFIFSLNNILENDEYKC